MSDVQTVIQVVETFLFAKLRNVKSERNYLYDATRMIRQAKGNLSIETLSEQLYVSKRQLERSFKENYGTTPKTYQRIIRFRNAYECVHQTATAPDWLDISYTFGYSDQAHFIRDFKEFSDEVPTMLFQETQYRSRTPACWGVYTKP